MEIRSITENCHNHLLASLSSPAMQRLQSALVPCYLSAGKVLAESGKPVHNIYFPLDAVVSLSYVTAAGSSAEISLVGNEGVVGIGQFLGGDSSHTTTVVEIGGHALRISSHAANAEFARRTEFMVVILRYIQVLMTQMAQTAACNRHHRVQQQLCRLLLLSLDRLPSNDLRLTQETIANMLGVRREGVTEAAGKLQNLGVIEYSRGHIRVLNRQRLEHLSCECYQVVKRETDRLLPLDCGYLPQADRSSRRQPGLLQMA
jgi:CRP-like cAMP-binding protein